MNLNPQRQMFHYYLRNKYRNMDQLLTNNHYLKKLMSKNYHCISLIKKESISSKLKVQKVCH